MKKMEHARVAFLGVGNMGYPMVEHLLRRGHSVWVWNRTRDKAMPLQEHGAVVVERVEEAVAAADVVIMMLFDTPAIRTLVMDSPAVREVLRGKIVVNAGTVAPTDNVRLRQEVLDLGGEFVEAPVLGATPVAHQGTLQVLVSGSKKQFDRLSPVFTSFGTPHHISEEVGKALTLKLALNQIVLGEIVLLSNSLAMVKNAGLSEETLLKVLRPSQLYAKYYDLKAPAMVSRDFTSQIIFDIAGAKKDIELITAEARRLGLDPTTLEGMQQVYGRAAEENRGADYVSVYNTINPPHPPPQ